MQQQLMTEPTNTAERAQSRVTMKATRSGDGDYGKSQFAEYGRDIGK
jgi:hypothetical protein